MTRFWLSWIQPTDDYRPLTDPPQQNVLGWWCSGYTANDEPILCALVRGKTLLSAKLSVKTSWPEVKTRSEWRIESEKSADWVPGDRFPLSDWMIQREKAYR